MEPVGNGLPDRRLARLSGDYGVPALCRRPWRAVNQKVLTLSEDRETRTAPLGLRIYPSLKIALERAAKDDKRSTASMAEIILTDYLREKGYLTK